MDEEIKKCTKTCVEKVREGKGKNNSQINQKNTENKKNLQSAKSENNEANQVNSITKEEKNQEGECSYKFGNEEFCDKNIDQNSKDYRKKNVQTCKKYFCPLCCEKKSSGLYLLQIYKILNKFKTLKKF